MTPSESDSKGSSSGPVSLRSTLSSSRGPLAWMAQNGVASNVLMAVLIAGGLAMLFTGIKQEVFPEVELDTIVVNVAYPGASPAEVEQGVILAAEEAVRGVDGIKEVRSTANEGVGVVAIELLLGADVDRALNDVKSAIDRITSFPQDIERPVISVATNRTKVVSLVIYGDESEATLRKLADDARTDLLQSEDITYVDLSGVRPLEISIEIPQQELRRHGLTLSGVADTIRASSLEVPAGGVKTRGGEILLRTAGRRDAGTEFGNIVLLSRPDGTQLRIKDIADVRDGFREDDRAAYFNGKPAAMVQVFRVGDETPLTVSAAVHEYVKEKQPQLPSGIDMQLWGDQSEMYEARIRLLERNAYIGLALVLIILGLFLEPKLAFWVTLGIPISFAGSLLFLPSADVSINMISLFAFIVTLGMVVDDAIVVGEAIYKQRADGKSRTEAAIAGVREVAHPVTFSILTTCIAFAPMLFVPGVMGKFFRVIPIVVIAVLLISLVESLVILPAHLAHRMPAWMRIVLWPFFAFMSLLGSDKVGQALEWFIARVYRPTLRQALRWRYLTFAICVATLVATLGLVAGGRIEFAFMPKVESDVVVAQLRLPVGTPAEDTLHIQSRMVAEAERIIKRERTPEGSISRGIFSDLGALTAYDQGPTVGVASSGSHLTTIMVYLVESDRRNISAAKFARDWRNRIGEIPGAEALTFRYATGANAGSAIDVQLSHPNPATLEGAAMRLAQGLEGFRGVKDIDSGVSPGKEQLDFSITPEGQARGLTEAELARQVRAAYYGSEAVRQQRGRDEIRVYVRRPKSERASLHDLESMVVRTPSGGEMPLFEAAKIKRGRAYTTIRRTDGRRTISVTADIAEGEGNANQVVASLTKNELPKLLRDVSGLSYKMGGEQREQADALGSLAVGFALALLVMGGLLAVAFRSYVQPLLVMTAIPFGVVGAIWGHAIMNFDLSIMSMMGIVALSGVVVNDSLILIVAVNRYREEKKPIWEAVMAGGVRRFRPILLTSLTTFFGLVPMIVETSVQARFLIPMAISLAFGVIFGTVILLVLVPATYLMLEDIRWVGRYIAARLQGAPAPLRLHSERPPPIESPRPLADAAE